MPTALYVFLYPNNRETHGRQYTPSLTYKLSQGTEKKIESMKTIVVGIL